jgi:hypothetical protein
MRNKDRADFLFILNHLKRLYEETELSFPRVFIINADNTLKSILQEAFPTSKHLLCVWHINKNI